MRRRWVAALTLLTTGCATSHEVVQCGPCAGPGVSVEGLPDGVRPVRVTLCLGDQPCTLVREREPLPTHPWIPLALTAGMPWRAYDGTRLRVTVAGRHRGWQGTGTVRVREPGGGPCDCGDFVAEVDLVPVPATTRLTP